MHRIVAALFGLAFFFNASAAPSDPPSKPDQQDSDAQEDNETKSLLRSIQWKRGPAEADVGANAKIKVPEGFMFTSAAGTRKLLEAMGNPTKLDPQKLLTTIKRGTELGNKRRAKMGAAPMTIIGWETPPKYNDQTHNLEWAIRAESEGRPVVNYNTRLLGREGVMEAQLVIKPERLQETLPTFQNLLGGYSYKSGHTYAEYKQGDKLSKYGLAALITGGAAAVAVKTGLLSAIILFLKKGAKLVIVAVVAVGAWIKRLVLGKGRENVSGQ